MSTFKDLPLGTANSKYFRLEEGMSRVRVLSEPVEVFTIFNKEEKTARKYLDFALLQDDPQAHEVRRRYAMWIMDRKDGIIRMAEFGVSIVRQIQALAMDSDFQFDSCPMPYDIKITKSGEGLSTEYSVTPSPISSLTEDEMARITALEKVTDFMAKEKGVVTKKNDEKIPF